MNSKIMEMVFMVDKSNISDSCREIIDLINSKIQSFEKVIKEKNEKIEELEKSLDIRLLQRIWSHKLKKRLMSNLKKLIKVVMMQHYLMQIQLVEKQFHKTNQKH